MSNILAELIPYAPTGVVGILAALGSLAYRTRPRVPPLFEAFAICLLGLVFGIGSGAYGYDRGWETHARIMAATVCGLCVDQLMAFREQFVGIVVRPLVEAVAQRLRVNGKGAGREE